MPAPTAPIADFPGTAELIERSDLYLSPNYGRFPIAIVRGRGSTLWDADGKRYLDLFAGFGAPVIGHCHPDLVKAVSEQAATLFHVGNLFYTEPQTRVAEAIWRHTADAEGNGLLSFFSHSGADANEAAIKLARLYGKANRGEATGEWGRYKVISTTKSFHGRSFATMGATGNEAVRVGFEPLPLGFSNVGYNDIDAVRAAIDDETVAVIAEPIQGEGGVNLPDPDYFKRLRELCDERDVLLIADEVWTGCGRTGRMFAHQHWGIQPDMMTLGKGVGGGLPVGVMAARPAVAEFYNAMTQGGVKHATTLGGNCVCMAATAAVFNVIERDGLLEHATRLGEHAVAKLAKFGQDTGLLTQVRGKGLFIGAELNTDKPDAWFNQGDHALANGGMPGRSVVLKAMERDPGVCVNVAQKTVIRIAPPMVITEQELDDGLDALIDTMAGG